MPLSSWFESRPAALLLSTFLLPVVLSAAAAKSELGLWFMRSPEPIVAPIGDDVVFECSLNVPAEAVRWRRDGAHYLNHSTPPRPSATSRLLVKFNDEKQEGDYQCVAWFGASALASTPARLTMARLQPFLYVPAKDITVSPGNNVAVYCPPPDSNPPAFIQYYHNNRTITDAGKTLPTTGTLLLANVTSEDAGKTLPTTGTLLLANVTSEDAGIYSCSATNYITGQLIYSNMVVRLSVNTSLEPQPPHFVYMPQAKYIVQPGDNITLECSGVGTPPPTATWRRVGGGGVVGSVAVGGAGELPDRATLIPGALLLSNVRPSDQGQYLCELSNNVPPMVAHLVNLIVQVAPVVEKGPQNAVVEEESDTELSCDTSGAPPPTVTWYLNGDTVDNDTHMTPMGTKLYIRRIQKRHAGIYQCFATNPAGVAFGSAMVQVSPMQVTASIADTFPPPPASNHDFDGKIIPSGGLGGRNNGHKKDHGRKGQGRRKKHRVNLMIPPSRPNVTRLSDRSVMVRWTVPENTGLPIQFFKVQFQDLDGSSRWMTSNEDIPPHIRSYEVDSLATDHHYRFRIAAVYSNNDNKLGRTSVKFHLQKGSASNKVPLYPPVLTQAEAVSTAAITIHWEYLNSVLAPVDGFYVYYRATSSAGDYSKATVEGETARQYTITHLAPDTAYDIKLQSFTVGAASDFSAIISHKTQREANATVAPEVVGVRDLSHSEVSSSHGQLYLVLGAVIAGLALLLALAIAICVCYRRSLPHDPHEGCDKTRVEAGLTIQQIEPVTINGFVHSAKVNGRTNGFVTRNMNITNNPLAESEQTKVNKNAMEMSYMTSQNNNCSAEGRNDLVDDLELELAAKRRASWRNPPPPRLPQRTTENYV